MPPNNQPSTPSPSQPYEASSVSQGPPPEYQSASQQKHDHHRLYLLFAIIFGVLFLGSIGFGVWAFMERNEYKNETDAIVAREIEQAVNENTERLEAEFIEREKEPLTSYSGPAAFGSVRVEYPKTWSAFVDESGTGSTPLEAYFHPRFVPDPSGDTLIALSVEVVNRTYDRALQPFERAANQGRVEIRPIQAENVDGVLGARVDGEIERDVQGSVVLFELRDKTLILTTQSTEFIDDFNNIILRNLQFNP